MWKMDAKRMRAVLVTMGMVVPSRLPVTPTNVYFSVRSKLVLLAYRLGFHMWSRETQGKTC